MMNKLIDVDIQHFPDFLSKAALSGATAAVFYTIFQRWRRVSVAKVPGPESSSWLHGNLWEFAQAQAGEMNFKWQKDYGDVVLVKGPLGEDLLLISDPKALQFIFQTASYRFGKHSELKVFGKWVLGEGLVAAEGNVHKRQRKILTPAFGTRETRASLPIFQSYISRLSSKWLDMAIDSGNQVAVVDAHQWITRAAMDTMGEAGFNYQFETLEHTDNALANSFRGLFLDVSGSPSKNALLFLRLIKYIPTTLIEWFLRKGSAPQLVRAREHEKLALKVAKDLVEQKRAELLANKERHDAMSLIVKANNSEHPSQRMTDIEMYSQMQTVLLAGHETTANTLSWTLLELAHKPSIQTRLRGEIQEMKSKVSERGDSDLTWSDYEDMPYLNAVIKETLRYHPPAYNTYREALNDEILPLSTPIRLTSGKLVTELPIPKGIKILASLCGYNRIESIFGPGSHTFDPDRWMQALKPNTETVGVYHNMMSFIAGPRACIGWRFAILELQAFLVELVDTFEFSLVYPYESVRREPSTIMCPTIQGQAEKGTQLPLKIRPVARS